MFDWSKYPITVNGKVLTPMEMWSIYEAYRVRCIAEHITEQYGKDPEKAMSLARVVIEVMDDAVNDGISEDEAIEFVMGDD